MAKQTQNSGSIFDKLFGSFFKGSSKGSAERKELRQISKILKKSRFKFYDVRLNELSLQFARFIYQLYRFFGPPQQLMARYANSEAIKLAIVEKNLTQEVLSIRSHFSEEAIRNLASTNDTKNLAQKMQQEYALFKKLITKIGIKQINLEYNSFQLFLQFVNFDYYYILKKFDPKFPELDFIYKPRFEPLMGVKVVEELKDFVTLLEHYNPNANWDDIFTVLNEFRGAEIISLSVWKKVKKSLDEIKKANVIEMIVAVIESDPNFMVKYSNDVENVVAFYVEKVGRELTDALKKVVNERKSKNISEYVRKIFDNKPPAVRLKNYSDRLNKPITEVCKKSFIYLQPANCMLAFFLDYIKKDFRDLVNGYVISGKWVSPQASGHMSDAFNRLLELADELDEFDAALGDDYRRGQAIRAYTRSNDPRNSAILERIVDEINNDAKTILVDIAQNMVRLAKIIRSLIEDHGQKKIIYNWKEVEAAYKSELLPATQMVYKKLYEMIQLLQMFLSK